MPWQVFGTQQGEWEQAYEQERVLRDRQKRCCCRRCDPKRPPVPVLDSKKLNLALTKKPASIPPLSVKSTVSIAKRKVSAIAVGGRRSVVSRVEDEKVAWKVPEPDVPMSPEEPASTSGNITMKGKGRATEIVDEYKKTGDTASTGNNATSIRKGSSNVITTNTSGGQISANTCQQDAYEESSPSTQGQPSGAALEIGIRCIA